MRSENPARDQVCENESRLLNDAADRGWQERTLDSFWQTADSFSRHLEDKFLPR